MRGKKIPGGEVVIKLTPVLYLGETFGAIGTL
jgi:hypothetical protein